MSELMTGSGSPDLSTLLSSLISNPEILTKMGSIISNLNNTQNSNNSPLDSNNQGSNGDFEENNGNNSSTINNISPTFQDFNLETILSKMPGILSEISSSKDENSLVTKQQITLLLAIRPYLSERRKELIDTFIKMNKLGAIFQKFNAKEG